MVLSLYICLEPPKLVPVPEEVGASSDRVVVEVLRGLFAAVVLARVSPDQVAHGPEGRRLLEAV